MYFLKYDFSYAAAYRFEYTLLLYPVKCEAIIPK